MTRPRKPAPEVYVDGRWLPADSPEAKAYLAAKVARWMESAPIAHGAVVTPLDLGAIERRLAAWSRRTVILASSNGDGYDRGDVERREADAAAVAHAPADIRALVARVQELEAALRDIAHLGRVCEEFETCRHPACADSCAAALRASYALSPADADDLRQSTAAPMETP